MKIVILAGGFGTRLAEYTEIIPKPMVTIGSDPILWHIMNKFYKHGHNDFYIALGYKSEVIKDYFLNYKRTKSNIFIDLKSKDKIYKDSKIENWKINLIDTGINTMTGGRLKRLSKYLSDSTFMLTYGDGLSDIDIERLISFHKSHGRMITVTAVRPPARFGELEINSSNKVISFQEKPQLNNGWINGGFFVVEPAFLNLIDNDSTLLEKEPLEIASKMGELIAYKHEGFWQCMDTKRDRDLLEKLYLEGHPWG
tara:strand:+ start:5520 stop:6281 length:762 start_codon:yes stop_codon:yes gene_type:complete